MADVSPEKPKPLLTIEQCRRAWDALYGGTPPPDPARDAVIAVMREMEARRKRDVDAYERCTGEGRIYDVTAAVADGGAARLIWALELLRQALDLPCEWETEAAQ